VVTDALGAKVAGLAFIFLFSFLVVLILAVPRLAAAWRVAEHGGEETEEEPQLRVVSPEPGPSGPGQAARSEPQGRG
jgi:hypothetical protein